LAAGSQRKRSSSPASASDTRASSKGSSTRRDDIATGWWTLLAGLVISGFLYWKNHSGNMWFEEYYLLNTAVLLGGPLLLILIGFRREVSEFGMTAGDVKGGAIAALIGFALFLPVLYFVARTPEAQEYYLGVLLGSRPGGSGAINGLIYTPQGYIGGVIDYGRLLFHESVFGFYMFGWEWFFRGFLLNGLRRAMPVWVAVAIQAALFCGLHVGKPIPEVCSSLAGGLLLGVVAIRFRSFLPCFFVHWAISATNDLAVLYFHFHPR